MCSATSVCGEGIRTNQEWDMIMVLWIFDDEGDLNPRIKGFALCMFKIFFGLEYDLVGLTSD